jgi:DnaD/phage-associated family protein
MNVFSGFGEGKINPIAVPETFFRELLPHIDHLGELKVILYTLWMIERLESPFRYLRKSDYLKDQAFMRGLNDASQEGESVLEEGLQRAVERGVLLAAPVELDGQIESLFFLNTPRGRAAVKAIAEGEWRATGDMEAPVELIFDAPNIYRLYEENIGPITPMIAEMLRDTEKDYSPYWIEEALRIAVENNVRNWRYVNAILKRWKEEGKVERKSRQDTEKARRRYIEGEFSEFIEH